MIPVSDSQYQRLLLEASQFAMMGYLAAENENYTYGATPKCYDIVAERATKQAEALLKYQGYDPKGT